MPIVYSIHPRTGLIDAKIIKGKEQWLFLTIKHFFFSFSSYCFIKCQFRREDRYLVKNSKAMNYSCRKLAGIKTFSTLEATFGYDLVTLFFFFFRELPEW